MTDASLAAVLRAKGLRLTAQRQLVLEAVHELGHATPDQVHAKVAEVAAGVNITTVYRTLDLLEELGVLSHAHLESGAEYHRRSESRHVHLTCSSCGAEASLSLAEADELQSLIGRHRGFRADLTHFAISGLCARCARHAG